MESKSCAPRATGTPVHELAALHVTYATTKDRHLRNRLAEAYDGFALAVARRFPSRRESFEDLAQVARVGLLGAIERFDPGRGRPFIAFARVTIEGELKHHIRDRTWAVRVPRSFQERYLIMMRTVDELTQELGRSPLVAEVARRAALPEEQVLEALELAANQWPASLDRPAGGGQLLEPAVIDRSLNDLEDRALLASLLERLPDRQQQVLRLRFMDGLTQAQIAARIGTSQMYVSRLLTHTLSQLEARGVDA